jgi:hypothetical protein
MKNPDPTLDEICAEVRRNIETLAPNETSARKAMNGIAEVMKVISGVIGYFIAITCWPAIPALLLVTASCVVEKGPCAPMFYRPFWHPWEWEQKCQQAYGHLFSCVLPEWSISAKDHFQHGEMDWRRP